jgi:hypothetical protein
LAKVVATDNWTDPSLYRYSSKSTAVTVYLKMLNSKAFT